MKKLIFCLFILFSITISVELQSQSAAATETQLNYQQKNLEEREKHLTESIERQERYIKTVADSFNRFIAIGSLVIGVIGVAISIAGYFTNKNAKKSVKEAKNSMKEVEKNLEMVREMKKNIELEHDKICDTYKTAEAKLQNIVQHEVRAQAIIMELERTSTRPQEQPEEKKQKIANIVNYNSITKPESEYTAEDWFLKGYKAHSDKKYKEACDYYKEAINKNPQYASAYNGLGTALSDWGKMEKNGKLLNESIENYKYAIERDSNYMNPYHNWGVALMRLGKIQNNLKEYKSEIEELLFKAKSIKKGNSSYNLACLYSLLNEKEEAYKWLNEYLENGTCLITREYIEKDEDFANIKTAENDADKRFEKLLDKYFSKSEI